MCAVDQQIVPLWNYRSNHHNDNVSDIRPKQFIFYGQTMIPQSITSRLLSGRDIAAEVSATLSNHRAWVWAMATLDPEKGCFDRPTVWQEPMIFSFGGAAHDPSTAINGYRIFYLEVREELVRRNCDITYDVATINQEFFVADLQELEQLLSQWLSDLSSLRVPHDTNYPF